MKKLKLREMIALLSSAILLSILLQGCAPTNIPSQKLPELVIGTATYAPYFYVNEDGQYTGIDAQIATEACRRMGYEPVFREIIWTNKDTYLEDGSVDCLWACFSMNNRENLYQWAGPYASDCQVIAVLANSQIQSLQDLAGRSVAVQMNSSPERIFLNPSDEGLPSVKTVYCLYDIDEVISALRREYVDACAGHEAALRHAMDDAGVAYRILKEPLLISKTGVAFSRNDDRGLCQKLQTVLDEMRRDGTINSILLSYGSENGGSEQ